MPSRFMLFIALLLIIVGTGAQASLRVASWNTLHLGWDQDDKRMDALAAVIDRFDVVALEEVMDPAAVQQLVARLSSVSDSEWDSVTSRAIGRGSYKEYRLGVEVWT